MVAAIFIRQAIVQGIVLAFCIYAYLRIGHPVSALVVIAMVSMRNASTADQVNINTLLLRLGLIHASKNDPDLDTDFGRLNRALLLDKTLMTDDEASAGASKQGADTLLSIIWSLAIFGLMIDYVFRIL